MSAEPISPKTRIRTIEILVGLGYLLLIGLVVFGCYFIYYLSAKQSQSALPSSVQNTQPIPTPHITTAILASSTQVFDENFIDNSRQWAYYRSAQNNGQTVGIKDKQLTLQSDRSGSIGIATCSPCVNAYAPYYIEADLATDISIDDTHGLVFELMDPDTDKLRFYSFVIDSQAKTYSLYHYAGTVSTVNPWSLRLRGSSQYIQAFPKYNVVGLYLDTGLAELYINGNLVDTYRQVGELFQTGGFGFFVDNYGFKVIASHLAYFTLNGAKP